MPFDFINPSLFPSDTENTQKEFRGWAGIGYGLSEFGEAIQQVPFLEGFGNAIERGGRTIGNFGQGAAEVAEGVGQVGAARGGTTTTGQAPSQAGGIIQGIGGALGIGQPAAGFTRARGELGANQGVYAAYLNGTQGYVDMSLIDPRTGNRGVWTPASQLSPSQKERVASEFSSGGLLGPSGSGEVSGRRIIYIKLTQTGGGTTTTTTNSFGGGSGTNTGGSGASF